MLFDTNFKGRVFQTAEVLDYGDAVSDQIISLGAMLKEMGFDSSIYTYGYHPDVQTLRTDLDKLSPSDEDVLIIHYSGYSGYMLPSVLELRCTKVIVYHNITPHTFFEPGTGLYELCQKGRQQLQEAIGCFHYFWGDSQYNLDELIELGASPNDCSLVPIIVGKQSVSTDTAREPGSWLFLGRIAENKGQINIVRLFAKARSEDSNYAQKLYIVGNYDPNGSYFQALQREIVELGLADHVIVTGKISDAEVGQYLAKASIYVSMSEHEGFGVPLIEAANHGLPVVALRYCAIGETLGGGYGLADSPDELLQLIKELLTDDELYRQTVIAQKFNAMRFSRESVNKLLNEALKNILPDRYRFTKVSVVICTYNRSELLERCLDYLQYQTNQNFEVVVINGPSLDNTQEVIERYQHRIKAGSNPAANLSISRNMGIELSDGDLIAFIDDDALPFDDWVETLIREFSQRPLTHAAIGGPAYFAGTLKFQVQDIGINKFAVGKVDIDSAEIGSDGWERSMLGTNTCFRADIVRKVRGFDEQFDYFLDESELSFRLQKNNYIVGYAPDLYLRHEFAQSDNRSGKHKFNWYSICKNTSYYIAAYSGLTGKELTDYIDKRMYEDRIQHIEAGFKEGEITLKECDDLINAVRTGAEQGLVDVQGYPKTRNLKPAPEAFHVYTCATAYPLIGRDLDALHICIITKEFPPFVPGGGIGTLYYHLVSELLLMGHRVTVIVPGDYKSVYLQGRLSVRYVPQTEVLADSMGASGFTNNMNWSISAFSAMAEVHSEQPIDIVDSALWDSEALALSLVPAKLRPPLVLRLVTPFPVAARINGWSLPEREREFFIAAERALIDNADAVIPISESIANTIEIEHKIKRDARWIKSYCGIAYWPSFDPWKDYAELKLINEKPLAVPKEGKIVLFLGRLERRKGVDLLLAAANDFLLADELAHLVLAGRDVEGWSSVTKNNISSELLSRVHFVGEVDDATREKLLNLAYCVIFPSRYESFGLVPLEAFVHGTPVIATRAGAIPEVVAHDECGLLFEAENVGSLSQCVIRMLTEPMLRERLAVGARKQIRRFSSRNSAINTIKLYASLLLKRMPPAKPKQSVTKDGQNDAPKSHSASYAGSHPRLQTQCGQRAGGLMKTMGAEGFIIYGPYVEMPAGRYRANISGQVNNVGSPCAYLEVLINSGADLLASQPLTDSKATALLASAEFNLEIPTQVEVRVWVASDADISIRKLVILSEQDFSD